jgi:hypothetical protein
MNGDEKMKVNLNPKQAKDYGNVIGRITDSGLYSVEITRAELITSKKGTKGVEFAIKDSAGATADYLSIWTHNSAGDEIAGMNALQALMTCLKLKTIETTNMPAKKYVEGRIQEVEIEGFKDFLGKPIGFILRKELYTKNNGGDGERMMVSGFYEPESGMVASEILDKSTQPVQLEKFRGWLTRSPVKDSRTAQPRIVDVQSTTDPFSEDIPF